MAPQSFVSGAASAALAVILAAPAAAQDAAQVRRELQQMRQQYDAQLEQMRRDYEARLQDLEQRLKTTETATVAATARAEEAQRSAQAVAPAPAVPASVSAFNPAVSAVLDGRFAYASQNPDNYRIPGAKLGDAARPDLRGFSLGETELNFSANIDQALYGNATISVAREGTISVEEAFFQTTALPWGFRLKAGRFFSGIGYLNEQHAHVWDFADAALPYRAFLNQQYGDDGAQLRWLAPTPFFLEFGAEAFRGDAFPAGGGSRSVGTYTGFVHAGDDIGVSSSYRVGVSHLRARAQNQVTTFLPTGATNVFNGRSNVTIFDAVYKWAPEGNPVERNLKLQGEYFIRDENGVMDGAPIKGTGQGFYLQGVYQFMPRWQVGLRYDRVRLNNESDAVDLAGGPLDTQGRGAQRYTTGLTYYTSEFGRFRLQYNLDESRPKTDHQAILQYTISLGAHGAHSY